MIQSAQMCLWKCWIHIEGNLWIGAGRDTFRIWNLGLIFVGWFFCCKGNSVPAESAHFIVENPILHLCSIFLAQIFSAKLVKTCRKKKCSLREAFCGENWTPTKNHSRKLTASLPLKISPNRPQKETTWMSRWKLGSMVSKWLITYF